MLQLKRIDNCSSIIIEFDSYIAVKIIFGTDIYWIDPIAYWRSGDFTNQLVEVGVSEKIGVIRKITIVDIKKIILENKSFPRIQLKQGIPVFDSLNYDKNLLFDEIGPLEMFVGKEKLQVLFSHNKIIFGLVCDRVICLFDKDNNFCGFEVSNITDKEMNTLKENFINRLYG